MNTNHLKKFAQEARRKLLEQVGAKLTFVLTTDSAELREKTEQLKQLRQELGRTTKEQLIEKVAYTWFNRLMALRFMDANDYQPLGIRIITPKDGYTIPELLDEAKRGNIPDELKINRQKLYDLLDNRIPSKNPQNEAFKELLIAVCNHLNTTFPFLFEKINDYTELLLPDDLTSDFSIVKNVRDGMLIEDCKNVEIIGWLYQFYISEEKDRLINSKKRYKAHEIAPVTQLFTPKWIVQYMVDNTLGQLWKEARPKTNVIKDLEFYIKPENEDIIPKRVLITPEDLTFFDPCVGSAHVLCYAFEIFFKIYEEEGFNSTDIPELIITKNLFGIDIDERAAQLAAFALMMKGRQYDKRLLRKGLSPNILAFQNNDLHPKFGNAQTIGSLINISQEEVEKIIIDDLSVFSENQKHCKKQAQFLSKDYDIIVTNPPYLNSSYMEGELKQFVDKEYSIYKSDLFACFLSKVTTLTKKSGLIGFICPYVWMFNKSYENLRELVIEDLTISTFIQLEYNAFGPAVVPICTFTLRNNNIRDYRGIYIKLSDFKGIENQAPKTLEAIKNPKTPWLFISDQRNFKKMPSYPIGFWVSDRVISHFENDIKISDIGEPKQGLITGDNERFLRRWWEVSQDMIYYLGTEFKSKKWFLYQKGGEFRKWYGNNEYVVNWSNGGEQIINFYSKDGKLKSRPQNIKYYFKEGMSWTSLTNATFNGRYVSEGFIFDAKGPMLFSKRIKYLIGFLNSNVGNYLLNIISPTIDFSQGPVGNLPLMIEDEHLVNEITDTCIKLSKKDWDANETSWDFSKNELLRINDHPFDFNEAIENYKTIWGNIFFKLHEYEEKLNILLVTNYGLQEDVSSLTLFENITILQNELEYSSLTKLNKRFLRDSGTSGVQNYSHIKPPFIEANIIAHFISYAVGCMFGRYSMDKEGLILANQGETLEGYFHRMGKSINEFNFLPDEDNIIPILEEDWFEDDIVGKFYQFLRVTFGEKTFNKNIAFIEEQIGKDIRKYFIKDFYPDHIKRYKKRPIYWMFSSPKGSFNVLIYMHRYTPDTVSNILNKYLKEFIGKLNTRKEHLERVKETGSVSDKSKAIKESDYIQKMLVELHEYERDILYPLATERIEIDLDDGVLVNYNKFGKAVKEVNGLNDPPTKKKVKQFDWIDTTQIK